MEILGIAAAAQAGLSAAGSAGVAGAASAATTLGNVLTPLMAGANIIQQRTQAKAQASAVAAQQSAEAQQAYQQQAIEDKRRRDRLRQEQASQRARFGAMGIAGGSAQAVLDGLRARSDQEAADSHNILAARLGADQQAADRTKRGILEEARARQMQALARFIGD